MWAPSPSASEGHVGGAGAGVLQVARAAAASPMCFILSRPSFWSQCMGDPHGQQARCPPPFTAAVTLQLPDLSEPPFPHLQIAAAASCPLEVWDLNEPPVRSGRRGEPGADKLRGGCRHRPSPGCAVTTCFRIGNLLPSWGFCMTCPALRAVTCESGAELSTRGPAPRQRRGSR